MACSNVHDTTFPNNHMALALSTSDLAVMGDADPRIEDVRLAEALGFSRPRDIRKIIDRHLPAIQRFGEVRLIVSNPSSAGGRPGRIYWLNKRQALYVTAKSDTARAADITVQMVEVFDAWQNGAAERPVHVRAHNRAKPSKYAAEARRRRTSVAVPNLDAYGWSKIALLSLGMLALIDEQKAEEIAALVATDARDRNLALTAAQNVAMYRQLDAAHAAALVH